jgi:hypothetical protein
MNRAVVVNASLVVAVLLVVAGVALLFGVPGGLIAGGCGTALLTFLLGGDA